MFTILLLLAAGPAAVMLVYVYRRDRIEKEPLSLLLKLLFGGLPAIVCSFFVELLLGMLIGAVMNTQTMAYILVDNFIGVALVEEFLNSCF